MFWDCSLSVVTSSHVRSLLQAFVRLSLEERHGCFANQSDCVDVERLSLWQVFLDVVESVNILVNSNGQLVRSEVVGALKMRTYLSGMPECKLGLNDRVLLEAQGRASKGKAIDLDDIKFHQ